MTFFQWLKLQAAHDDALGDFAKSVAADMPDHIIDGEWLYMLLKAGIFSRERIMFTTAYNVYVQALGHGDEEVEAILKGEGFKIK